MKPNVSEAQPLVTVAPPPPVRWRAATRWLRWLETSCRQLAARRRLSIVIVGLSATLGSAAMALLVHMPQPRIHDEFSYLLAADTFAHGRLTNPPHPLWVHFESFHIIQQPTYASKYPPGQGLILALGQALTGNPAAGVWLSAGLACAAITWMLFAWLPPRWALLGGFLVVLRIGIAGDWSQSYWGGWVAAMGGALVFGGLRRLIGQVRTRDAVLLALGLAILANSRPYEGLLASLPAGAALLMWMSSSERPPVSVTLRQVVLPILVVLGITAGAMGFYNLRVTGNPFLMPYQVHEATYSNGAELFLWQPLRPEPQYRHKVMRDFHTTGWVRDFYEQQHTLAGFLQMKLRYFNEMRAFFLGFALTPLLLLVPCVWRDRWMGFAMLTCGIVALGLLPEFGFNPHYAAPVIGLLFVLLVQAMRHLRAWRWRGSPAGQLLVWAIVGLCVVGVITRARAHTLKPSDWSLQRARLFAQLQRDGQRHLVIVRYGPRHNPLDEWVYNEADIDRREGGVGARDGSGSKP
ncbi:MAG: hypothetical protein ACHQ9S_13260 [Candidatus Binatia bacterium]